MCVLYIHSFSLLITQLSTKYFFYKGIHQALDDWNQCFSLVLPKILYSAFSLCRACFFEAAQELFTTSYWLQTKAFSPSPSPALLKPDVSLTCSLYFDTVVGQEEQP